MTPASKVHPGPEARQTRPPPGLPPGVPAPAYPPARPCDARLAPAVRTFGLVACRTAATLLAEAAQQVEGAALTGPDSAPRAATALRWQAPGLLVPGTVGAGVVLRHADTGPPQPDPDPVRADRAVLSLPAVPRRGVPVPGTAGMLMSPLPEQPVGLPSLRNALQIDARQAMLGMNGVGDQPDPPALHAARRVAVGTPGLLQIKDDASRGLPLKGVSFDDDAQARLSFGRGDRIAIAMVVTHVGTTAFVGYRDGLVVSADLTALTSTARASMVDVADFARSGDTGDGLAGSRAIVALAGARSAGGQPVAAAASEGRIAPVQAMNNVATPPEAVTAPGGKVGDVGLPAPTLWEQAVQTAVSTKGVLGLLGFSTDQSSVTFCQDSDGVLVQTGPGRSAGAEVQTPPAQGPDGTFNRLFPGIIAPIPAELPILSADARVPALHAVQDFATPEDAAGRISALRWVLPRNLPPGLPSCIAMSSRAGRVRFAGAAFDRDCAQTAASGRNGKVVVFSASGQVTVTGPGGYGPVADAAFRPCTAAPVVLTRDGAAHRWADGARGATGPAFAHPFSPEAARLISAPNADEGRVRDAHTDGTLRPLRFEGGNEQLAPLPDRRDPGLPNCGGEMWTLCLDPPGGGTPPPCPEASAVTRLDDRAAVPVPMGLARDGSWLSADGGTLLAPGCGGQALAARPAQNSKRGPDQPCCIGLRPILSGMVAIGAVLAPDGGTALVGRADHALWQLDPDKGDAAGPLVHLAAPVRAMASAARGASLSWLSGLYPDETALTDGEPGGALSTGTDPANLPPLPTGD